MKKLFFITVIFLSYYANSQVTPGGIFDTLYDKEGQKYALLDLAINPLNGSNNINSKAAPTSSCSAGYFNLYFSPTSAFVVGPNASAYQNVICNLFTDISNFINSPLSSPTNTLKINIFCNNTGTASSGPLATASSFYMFPSSPNSSNPGISDNAIYKMINTGIDPLTNLNSLANISSGFYHGYVNVNPTSLFHTNLSSVVLNPTDYDLYSVMLHEALHALGFASLIDGSGTSVFGASNNYYSRYDTYLTNALGLPLLSSSTPSCSTGNLAFTGFSTQIAPGSCISTAPANISNCSQAARFIAPGVNVSVFTPNCFKPGSSLSHFEDLCSVPASFTHTCPTIPIANNNDLYYVMSNAAGTGNCYVKRYIKEEERLALCNLGYSVNTTYNSIAVGANYTYTNSCSPNQVIGVDDGISNGIITYTAFTNITIPLSALVANDIASLPLTAGCISMVYANPSVIFNVIGNSNLFVSKTNTSFCGPVLLKYIPKTSTGVLGNPTYIYIDFVCQSNCNPSGICEMVQNGGFESTIGPGCGAVGSLNLPNPAHVDCWHTGPFIPFAPNSPDLFSVTSCTSISLYSIGSPQALVGSGLMSTHNGGSNNNVWGMGGAEIIINKLSTSLVPTNTYVVSMWVFRPSGFNHNAPTNFTISIVAVPQFTTAISTIITGVPGPYDILADISVSQPPLTWKLYTTTVVFNPTNNVLHNSIILGISANTTTLNNYCMVDDVSIVPAGVAIPFVISQPCGVNTYTDLAQYLTTNAPITGTFSGIGVTNSGSQFDFNISNNLPVGVYNITYSYLTNLGCTYSTVATASVSGITTNTNATTCSSGNYTLNATAFAPGTTFNWQPGGATTSSIAVNVTNTTIFTLTASNGSCTAQYTTAINIPTLSISPVPPICINSSSGFLQTYLSAVTPTTGAFLGPNLINGNCGGNICSYIDLAITPQPAPGVYTYSYVVPTNTSIGIFCTKTITFNVTYLPPFTTSISALPTGTNCFTSGQTYTLVANPNPLGSINYTWFPGGNTTSSIVITPTTNVV